MKNEVTFYKGYFYCFDAFDMKWFVEYMDYDTIEYERMYCDNENECRNFIDKYLLKEE